MSRRARPFGFASVNVANENAAGTMCESVPTAPLNASEISFHDACEGKQKRQLSPQNGLQAARFLHLTQSGKLANSFT
jgi:hypothetical protein